MLFLIFIQFKKTRQMMFCFWGKQVKIFLDFKVLSKNRLIKQQTRLSRISNNKTEF
jgi:hypothetical protein